MADFTSITLPGTVSVSIDTIPRPNGTIQVSLDLDVSVTELVDDEGLTNYEVASPALRAAMIAALRQAANDLEAADDPEDDP